MLSVIMLNVNYAECQLYWVSCLIFCYAECRYAKCHGAMKIIHHNSEWNWTKLGENVCLHMLNVIMLSVIVMSVVAPFLFGVCHEFFFCEMVFLHNSDLKMKLKLENSNIAAAYCSCLKMPLTKKLTNVMISWCRGNWNDDSLIDKTIDNCIIIQFLVSQFGQLALNTGWSFVLVSQLSKKIIIGQSSIGLCLVSKRVISQLPPHLSWCGGNWPTILWPTRQ